MRIPGLKTLSRFAQPLVSTLRPGGFILGYHRIADSQWDPLNLCVHPDRFRQHLDTLSDLCEPVPLRHIVSRLRQGQSTKNMVALTFDDGYKDFISNALPELDRFGIAATVFVPTEFLGASFWWDQVAELLRPEADSPQQLLLRFGEAGSTREYTGLTDSSRAAHATRAICEKLASCGEVDRNSVLEQIRSTRSANQIRRPVPLTMTSTDIAALVDTDNVEIGSHTASHPLLADLTVSEQREELERGKREIREITGETYSLGLSYPNGSYSAETCRQAKLTGFDYACSSRQNVVRAGADPYCLPRLWPPNSDRRVFGKWLSAWRGICPTR